MCHSIVLVTPYYQRVYKCGVFCGVDIGVSPKLRHTPSFGVGHFATVTAILAVGLPFWQSKSYIPPKRTTEFE
jgi:hypothetical protein